MNKSKAIKRMLGIRLQEVRGYYDRMLAATSADFRAFDERNEDLDKRGNKRELRVQDGVAIIPIRGILSQYFDFWCWLFGGVATEDIDAQFDAALESSTVRGIILDIDSPGGEIGGVNDLADKIHKARGDKPIVAYSSDTSASAAYWLGAAADHVVAGSVALVGSIGIIASFGTEKDEHIDFFSSVSPKKKGKADTAEGAEQIQQWVDDIGKVFVQRMAHFRGVSSDHVLNNFGKGDVMIAENALAAGMIDNVGNFQAALQLASGQPLEAPATGGGARSLSAKNNEGKNKTMKNKIFAIIKKGSKRAELVIVDTDSEDAVIPDDAIALSEIDIPFLEQNLPELVEEIRQEGRDEENGRQEELDEMEPEPEAGEHEDDDDEERRGIMKKARRDTKVKASDVALKLMKASKGQPIKPKAKNEEDGGDPVPRVPSTNGKTEQTDKEKSMAEFKTGTQKAADSRLGRKKVKAGGSA